MNITPILDRLEQPFPARADLKTLRGLYRAWRTHVPYENFDLQLGRDTPLDSEFLVDKFGVRRRGGTCFQMNGTLALLLRGVGFDVDIVESGVQREKRGEDVWGNHIALLVHVDGQRWLADVGIGDSFLEPLPLTEGTHRQGTLDYRLERLSDGVWRARHHAGGSVSSWDFRTVPRELSEFAENARHSTPVMHKVLVAQHHRDGHELALRSRVLTDTGPAGKTRRVLEDLADFTEALKGLAISVDDLGPDNVRLLWNKTASQYQAWLDIEKRIGV